jgi:hypothetical protein
METNEMPTQEKRVLGVLLAAKGGWVSGQYFLREMMLSQYHRAIFNLEKRDGWEIEHSPFKDEFGFLSYRITNLKGEAATV